MEKKQIFYGALLVLLAAVYVIFFSHWFDKKTLLIHHTSRPSPFAMRTRRTDLRTPMTFGFDEAFRLTEVKVVSIGALQTNAAAMPIWHLVTDSNSIPVQNFFYGQSIRGMKPAVAGARPQPLETNVQYRLFVTTEKIKGQHDFEIK